MTSSLLSVSWENRNLSVALSTRYPAYLSLPNWSRALAVQSKYKLCFDGPLSIQQAHFQVKKGWQEWTAGKRKISRKGALLMMLLIWWTCTKRVEGCVVRNITNSWFMHAMLISSHLLATWGVLRHEKITNYTHIHTHPLNFQLEFVIPLGSWGEEPVGCFAILVLILQTVWSLYGIL